MNGCRPSRVWHLSGSESTESALAALVWNCFGTMWATGPWTGREEKPLSPIPWSAPGAPLVKIHWPPDPFPGEINTHTTTSSSTITPTHTYVKPCFTWILKTHPRTHFKTALILNWKRDEVRKEHTSTKRGTCTLRMWIRATLIRGRGCAALAWLTACLWIHLFGL